MQPLLLAIGLFGVFDGSILAIFKHLPLVFAIAYGPPLAAVLLLKWFFPSLDLLFLLRPLQWVLSADPASNASLSADIAELRADIAAIKAATVQPPVLQKPAA